VDAAALASVLAWGALKGALLLGVAAAAAIALRQASAAARHAVWAGALAASLVLPLLDAVGPAWRLAILPAAEPAFGMVAPTATTVAWLPSILVAMWLVGLLGVTARWIASALAARRLAQRARDLDDIVWRADTARYGNALGLRRSVALRTTPALTSPVAWGFRHPVLILPEEAPKWSPERRRAVLMHELAHVRRRDCLTGLVAEAACAVHWFNPLAWIAYRRLHVERERACDDGVLRGGLVASRYASHLLAVAREAGRARESRALRLAPALTRRTEMEERVRAMLDGRPRSGPLSRAVVSALGAVTLVAAGVLGAVDPVRRAAPPVVATLAPLVDVSPAPFLAPAPRAAPEVPSPAPVSRPAPEPPAPPAPPPPPTEFALADVSVSPAAPTATVGVRTVVGARTVGWRAPSGPMASDEPVALTRVVRVVRGSTGSAPYVLVFPDLPAGFWRERTDEARVIMERSVTRMLEERAAVAGQAALGVHTERLAVRSVRRERHDGVCVDSAAREVYRALRDEAIRGKDGA
jgi:beta-lactamase regulating signal transducer with metallopeptidase domain